MERKATEAERQQGLDIADYLIRFDYRKFIVPEVNPEPILKSEDTNGNSNAHTDSPSLSMVEQEAGNEQSKPIHPINMIKPEPKYQTYGEVFDLLYARGYKSLPKNIQISVPGW